MNHILWDQLRLRLQVAGDFPGALEANRESLRQAPTAAGYHLSGAEIALASGKPAEARDSLESSIQLQMEPTSAGFLASRIYLLNRLGMVEQAEVAFRDLVARSANYDVGAGGWALANLGIGDRQQMEIWLERAAGLVAAKQADVGLSNANFIRLNIMRDPLLEEPEYVQLRSRLAPPFSVKRVERH